MFIHTLIKVLWFDSSLGKQGQLQLCNITSGGPSKSRKDVTDYNPETHRSAPGKIGPTHESFLLPKNSNYRIIHFCNHDMNCIQIKIVWVSRPFSSASFEYLKPTNKYLTIVQHLRNLRNTKEWLFKWHKLGKLPVYLWIKLCIK